MKNSTYGSPLLVEYKRGRITPIEEQQPYHTGNIYEEF